MLIHYSELKRSAVDCKKQNRLCGVYGLFDDAKPDEILYVGASQDIHQRLYQHYTGGNIKTPLAERILQIRASGRHIGVNVLQILPSGTPRAELNRVEENFIRKLNPPLNVALSAVGHVNSKDSPGKKLRSELVELRERVAVLESTVRGQDEIIANLLAG